MLRKLAIIIMGIFLVICAGACNIYPLYLKKMMDKFDFSLKEVNLYGTFINLGLWIAFPMGWIYDALGPKISCLIGCLFLSGSYLALHFIFASEATSISIVVFLVIALVMGQGSALCYTTSVTTNLKNFRFKESSAVVGLLVANMALSPSVFTTYREAMKDLRTNAFFTIIAIFILIVILICVFIFSNIKRVYAEDEQKQTYEKYKEKKIIKFLIFLNIFILIVYTFGVLFHSVWEDEAETSKFPLVIIYPCLQLLNFVVVFLEYFKFFDKLYFKPYIDKMIMKQAHAKKGSIYKINESKDQRNLSIGDVNNSEKSIKIENSQEQGKDSHSDHEGEFTEMKLDSESNSEAEHKTEEVNMNLGSQKDKTEAILDKVSKIEDNKDKKENQNQLQQMVNSNEEMNISFKEAICSQNVIFLFIILLLGIGSEISNLNNIEFIVMSIMKSGPSVTPNYVNSSNITNLIIDTIITNTTLANTTLANTSLTNTTLANTTLTNTTIPSNLYPVPPTTNSKSNVIYSFVVLYFVFNSFTRIISGLLLDHLIKIKKLFYYLIVITAFGIISQLLGIFMDRTLLLISISLAGACHGGYSTFIPVFVRNEYGLSNMGKILGILTTGNAVGALLISDGIFILFYNSYSVKGECYGSKCFSYAYIITTFFFCVNLVLSIVLLRKDQKKNKETNI